MDIPDAHLIHVPFGAHDANTVPAANEGDTFVRLAPAVHAYLAARKAELSPITRRNLRGELVRAAHQIGPEMLVRVVRRRHVEQWLSAMDCAPSTIRVRLSQFRQFCRWCIAVGLMKTDPTFGIRGPKQPRSMPREITPGEWEVLLTALPDTRARLIVTLGFVQGLRGGSIAGQLREDIDLDGGTMLVSIVKGGGVLWLPLDTETIDTIRAYYREIPGQTGPLVRSVLEQSKGLSAYYVGRLVAGWMADAGVKQHALDGKSAHALRHGFCGGLIDAGVDVRVVQHLMGHASLGSTFIYTRRRFAEGPLREAMQQRREYRDAS